MSIFRALIISALLLLSSSCAENESSLKHAAYEFAGNAAHAARRGNITYDLSSFQSGYPYVPLMVSNGIVGGCFDQMGFQSTPDYGYPQGRTAFGYVGNYDRHVSSRQIQFPLAVIQAEFADGNSILNLVDSKNYSQVLDIYDGVLTTKYDLFGPVEITSFASQSAPNLFVMKILRKTDEPDKKINIRINCETSDSQNKNFPWPVDPIRLQFNVNKDEVNIRSQTDISLTDWTVKTNSDPIVDGHTIIIPLESEENMVRIFVKRDDCPGREVLDKSWDNLLNEHISVWHKLWDKSWVDLPDNISQAIWTRMKYYDISNFPPVPEKPMIPTGLNSNIWGFTFPQDVYYVARTLPRLGLTDRFEKAFEYWLKILPDVETYCRRIMGVEGAYYPWTPPFTDWDSYERNGVVAADSYELHNPAYVAAMVWQYYLISRDRKFLETYFPILEGVCRFYANISVMNDQGTYDVYHEHGRGQDEASSTDGKLKNLLCASYSAEYTVRNYLLACNELDNGDTSLIKKAESIRNFGYSRNNLLRSEGWYATYEGDKRPLNSQKHPVQLNPVAYLPMPDLTVEGSPVETAWRNRYDLTKDARKPLTLGWTIGEFALTSCRMRDPAALKKDLLGIQPCHGADPRWIQFYESSFWPGWHMNKSYYFPMMALYLDTFTDAIVQDWRGYTDLFACLLPEWQGLPLTFKGIRTAQGITVSGYLKGQEMNVIIQPSGAKDADIRVSGKWKHLSADGMKDGPSIFEGNQVVHFVFDGAKAIRLSHTALKN